MSEITIAYLSWKKHDILEQTLKSHQENGLFDIISPENRIIFFQEISQQDRNIADKYNLNTLGNKENIGILNAFIELVQNCKTKYFIFSENDFLLLKNDYNISKTINDVCKILENNPYSQIKLSNYKNPGFLYIKGGPEWLKQDQSNFKYKVESLSWTPNPKEFYPNMNILNYNYEWFQFESQDQCWSNHIYACNTNYLKEIVLPLLIHNRDNNKELDIKYQGVEDTLNLTDKIPNQSERIKELIVKHNMRKICSGGGNFFHNKK